AHGGGSRSPGRRGPSEEERRTRGAGRGGGRGASLRASQPRLAPLDVPVTRNARARAERELLGTLGARVRVAHELVEELDRAEEASGDFLERPVLGEVEEALGDGLVAVAHAGSRRDG